MLTLWACSISKLTLRVPRGGGGGGGEGGVVGGVVGWCVSLEHEGERRNVSGGDDGEHRG